MTTIPRLTVIPDPTSRCALHIVLAMLAATVAQGQTLVVNPDGRDLDTAYVVQEIDAHVSPGTYKLMPAEGDAADQGPGFASVFIRDGTAYLGAIVPGLHGASRTFAMRPAAGDETTTARVQGEGGGEFTFLLGDDVFARLVQGEFKPYLYPVIGPSGRAMTRAYPMEEVEGEARDHNHQRSFWFTHGNVNGYDFWASDPKNNPSPKYGTIRQTSADVLATGGAVAILRTTDDWLAPDGSKVCSDERKLTLYASESPRILDVEVTIKATAGPVTFGDTKEGMFGVRVASSMDVKRGEGGKITNAEGITDLDAWGKPSSWVDYTGPVGGEIVGVAILNHPESFRYPTTWHVRDYGLFAANPFGYGDFKSVAAEGAHTLPAGESMTFRYRVILHEGTTGEAGIARRFESFANPPGIEVQP